MQVTDDPWDTSTRMIVTMLLCRLQWRLDEKKNTKQNDNCKNGRKKKFFDTSPATNPVTQVGYRINKIKNKTKQGNNKRNVLIKNKTHYIWGGNKNLIYSVNKDSVDDRIVCIFGCL